MKTKIAAKRTDGKETTVASLRRTVAVGLSVKQLAVANALALVMTEFYAAAARASEPMWQEEEPSLAAGDVLEAALSDGLLALERKFLGTRTTSENAPEEGEKLPSEEQLALVAALVKATAAAVAPSSAAEARAS